MCRITTNLAAVPSKAAIMSLLLHCLLLLPFCVCGFVLGPCFVQSTWTPCDLLSGSAWEITECVLSLYTIMYSSFWFGRIHLELSIVYIKGLYFPKRIVLLSLRYVFV